MSDYKEHAKSIVQIDPDNLDKECISLASDYLNAAFHAAEARMDVDESKNALDVVKSDLQRDIRERPDKYGLQKVTEGGVESVVIGLKEYRNALTKLNDAKRDAELSQALVWALEHKKRALTLLVELHGTSYFANPKLSPEGTKVVQRMTQDRVRRPGPRAD